MLVRVVPGTGLEPAHLAIPDPKSGASTNSAIPAAAGTIASDCGVGKESIDELRWSALRQVE
jgi:hypothetical protein